MTQDPTTPPAAVEAPAGHPTLVLAAGREKSLRNRHPWVFSGAVASAPEGAKSGQIVAVADQQGRWLGYGFYAPESQIRCRVFEFDDSGAAWEEGPYWHARIAAAVNLRRRTVLDEQTDACRLCHAEGDQLPGLIVDAYGPVAVAQILTLGIEGVWPHLAEGLRRAGYTYIYRNIKATKGRLERVRLKSGWEGAPYPGSPTAEAIPILENGHRFTVHLARGQKTGFFLDQRDARALLAQYSAGARVLNAFSYTGGFSIYALAAGAEYVDSVDVSAQALARLEEQLAPNGLDPARHESHAKDVFEYLSAPPRPYDVIVLDPPAFAKKAGDVAQAARGYKQINLNAFRVLPPGGILFTFSCSQHIDRDLFRKIVFGAAADARRHVRILHQTTQPPCHPVSIYHPEGEYLKGIVLEVT